MPGAPRGARSDVSRSPPAALDGTLLGGRALPSPRVRAVVDRIPFLDRELFVLGAFLPTGATMVDIGAAGGVHALLGARHVGPEGRVIAIEARTGSAAILRRWRAVLGLDNVTVLSTALGAAPGSLELRTPVVATRTHTDQGAMPATDGWLSRLPSRVRTVGMTTLDLVVAAQDLERIDLVKIDVEGAEPDVLAGGVESFERFRPVVVIEIEERHLRRNGHSTDKVWTWFTEHGYTGHVLGDGGLVAVDAAGPDEHNYVFLPSAGS